MKQFRIFFWTLTVLLGFWRKNRLSLITLIVGLGVATALWSGVQAINAEARASYDRAAATLGGDQFRALTPLAGDTVPQTLFATLRRAGWAVSPVVEGTLRLDGTRLRLIGIDPLTLPDTDLSQNDWLSVFEASNDDLQAFLTPPFRAFAHPDTIAQIDVKDSATLPPLAALATLPPGSVLT
ncbi:MAG: ABC transporter permease, partial [Hyphomicrobiales bacterium]